MLMLLLLALHIHIVFIHCRCPSPNKAPRAIDIRDGAGFAIGQYAGSVNAMDNTLSYNPEDVTALGPDGILSSADYSEQPDNGSPGIVAELDYDSLCDEGDRLGCCKELTEEDRSWPDRPNRTPELPDTDVPQCIWTSTFDPGEDPLHIWINDWCLNENLACCSGFPERSTLLWSECEPLRLPPSTDDVPLQHTVHGMCPVHPAAPL